MRGEGAETQAEVYLAAAQVSEAAGSIGSIQRGPSRLSADPRDRPPLRPVRFGASRLRPVRAGSQCSVPRLRARQPACLPPLALPLRLPLPPSWLLAPRSLLLQINFVAEERGREAGPRAQKRGWAPGAREAGNRDWGGGNLGGVEGETRVLEHMQTEATLRRTPSGTHRPSCPPRTRSDARSSERGQLRRHTAGAAHRLRFRRFCAVTPSAQGTSTWQPSTRKLVHTDIQVHPETLFQQEGGGTRRQGEQ